MTFSPRCSLLSLVRRPSGGLHAEHVRRALRLTPSGGEPVTGNDLLGAAHRRGRFRREARSRNGDVEDGGGFGALRLQIDRPACVDHVTTELGISERRACRALGQHRSTQRKTPTTPDDEAALTADIIELARQYGRYGYR